jgi:NACHT domain
MTSNDLQTYLSQIGTQLALPLYVDRLFRTNDEWDRISGSELRRTSLSSRTESTLDDIINHRVAVILGEPGSGKTTVAQAAVRSVLSKGWVPLFARLRSYDRDLTALLRIRTPESVVRGEPVDGVTMTRVLILDGFDEIPQGQLEQFTVDLADFTQSTSAVRVLLTSRQAFFETASPRLPATAEKFYLLDFSDKNVRHYVEHYGGDYAAFMAEVNRVEMGDDVGNPFSLDVLLRSFIAGQSLGRLRHEAVDNVVEALIATKPEIAADGQRRALRMLAVAMEAASRNVLSMQEAIQLLQSATRLSAAEAETLLNELTKSILVRTRDGICFQLRSHGEWLAALELRERPIERIMLLVRHKGSLVPNESWRNCVSFLAELHPGVRHLFTMRHPDWMTDVAPAAFTDAERDELLNGLLDALVDEHRYLWRHPVLSIGKVARFVTGNSRQRLVDEAGAADTVRAANAIVLLAAIGDDVIRDIALSVAIDLQRPRMLRGSAIAALSRIGDASLIPTLMAHLVDSDPLHLTLVDCIGTLTDAGAVTRVLPLLLQTDAMVTGAFYRFQELGSVEAIDQFMQVLAGNPGLISSLRLDSYSAPLWEAMPRLWQARWSVSLGDLILHWERHYVDGRDINSVEKVLNALGNRSVDLVKHVLGGLLQTGDQLFSFRVTISRLVSPELAEWLAVQPNAVGLMRTVASCGSDEVRGALAPHLNGFVELQDTQAAVHQQRQEKEATREHRRLEQQQQTVISSSSILEVLGQLSQLDTKNWPDLDESRVAWLNGEVQRLFAEADPARTIVWHNDNQYTAPNVLPVLAHLVARYELELADDKPLVQSLLAVESEHIASSYIRHPFSAAAINELERILSAPETPNGALYNFLGFLNKTKLRTASIWTSLSRISEEDHRPQHIRSWAVRCCSGMPIDDLERLGSRLTGALQLEVLDLLVECQHRPTIERRLAPLLQTPTLLQQGEVEFHQSSPLDWISKIATVDVWPRLVALREHSLRLALGNVSNMLTATMQRIDGIALADVVRSQASFAPADWQEGQHLRAYEIERDARLQAAQATPFEEILNLLRRATTLSLYKVWCEGPTDAPTIAAFVEKLANASRYDVVTDALRGWDAILNPAWEPQRLADGCHDLVVILDGDKARDWSTTGHPYKALARQVLGKMTAAGVPFFILQRYGIENYFTQRACEKVLGRDLSAYFPMPPYSKVVLPSHTKNENPRIAHEMTLDDIATTDLADFLSLVERRSRVN